MPKRFIILLVILVLAIVLAFFLLPITDNTEVLLEIIIYILLFGGVTYFLKAIGANKSKKKNPYNPLTDEVIEKNK